jgi:LPXTG-motif cell wall-anchored protein
VTDDVGTIYVPDAPVVGQSRSAFFGSIGEALGVEKREGGASVYVGAGVVLLVLSLVGWFIWKRRK